MDYKDYILECVLNGQSRTSVMFKDIQPHFTCAQIQNMVKELMSDDMIITNSLTQYPIINGLTKKGEQYIINKLNNVNSSK